MGIFASGSCIAYGKLYALALDGLHVYDVHTGQHSRDFLAESSDFETAYGIYEFGNGGFTMADGKVYIFSGHGLLQPLHRGAKMYCIDAETGKEEWSVSGWYAPGWTTPPAIS